MRVKAREREVRARGKGCIIFSIKVTKERLPAGLRPNPTGKLERSYRTHSRAMLSRVSGRRGQGDYAVDAIALPRPAPTPPTTIASDPFIPFIIIT